MPKILVADDSIAVRKVAERLLLEAGLSVTLAANGEEALAYLAKERPDVVVSDVIMPDKSGYEVCAFVRGNASLASIPVLLISGIVNDEVTKQAESCRADGVLKKPFQGTSLKDRILELLSKRQGPAPAAAAQPTTASVGASHEKILLVSEQPQQNLHQEAGQLKELEQQLQAERTRSEGLANRLAESAAQLAHAKESEAQLATERQRVSELQEKVTKLEQSTTRISELESSLKAEQETAAALKQEAANWQKASSRVAELESALNAERAAAEQLVQQLAESESLSVKVRDAEARLANDQQRMVELQQTVASLEADLVTERKKGMETTGKVQEFEAAAARIKELEELLTTERERNVVLIRRAVEAEQAAESATRRFEEMARKLGEIAGLASQLGNARGQS